MNWIRVATTIMDDSKVDEVAVACGVRIAEAAGLMIGVLTHLPSEARDGNLGAISDRLVERWACWEGERGLFAATFRKFMCDESGAVRAWEKYNGKALRDADKSADRVRQWREKRAEETEAKRAGTSRVTPETPLPNAYETRTETAETPLPYAFRTRLRNETRRNETEQLQQELIADDADAPVGRSARRVAPPKAPKPSAKYPGFTDDTCNAAYDLWLERAGAVDYAQFRKAFGPVFAKAESDRPTALPRDAELIPLVRLYLSAIRGTSGAKFVRPDACAKAIAQLAVALRTGESPEHRLTLAQHALGLTDEIRRLARAA